MDEKTCAWMVFWTNNEGFTDYSFHLDPEGAKRVYEGIRKDGNFKMLILAPIKEWVIA